MGVDRQSRKLELRKNSCLRRCGSKAECVSFVVPPPNFVLRSQLYVQFIPTALDYFARICLIKKICLNQMRCRQETGCWRALTCEVQSGSATQSW